MEFNRVATKEQQEKVKGNPFAAFMKVGDQIYDLMLKDTDSEQGLLRDGCLLDCHGTKRSCRVYAETSGSYQGITYQGSCRIRPKWYDEL